MVKIDLFSGGIREKIPILVMTLYTRQAVLSSAMVHYDISMGEEGTIFHQYILVSMEDATTVSGCGILPGKDPEGTTLPGFFGPHRFNRQLMGRVYFHGIKGLVRMMNLIHNPATGSHGGLAGQEHCPRHKTEKKQARTQKYFFHIFSRPGYLSLVNSFLVSVAIMGT